MSEISGRFFLVGCPRSGTTLLQSLIASHPRITSFPESHFFSKVQAKWRCLRALGVASWKTRSHLFSYFKDIGHEDVLKHSLRFGMVSISAYVDAYVRGLDAVARRRKVPFWLDKTPQHLHYIEHIQQYVPKTSIIHIVRRGEDVVASMFEVTRRHPEEWGGKRDVKTCLERWRNDINFTLQYGRFSNHIVLHYDDVVQNTEASLQRVCRHLGVDYDAAMLDQYKETAQRVRTNQETWKERTTDEISSGREKFGRLFDVSERSKIREKVKPWNAKIKAFRL